MKDPDAGGRWTSIEANSSGSINNSAALVSPVRRYIGPAGAGKSKGLVEVTIKGVTGTFLHIG